MEAKRPLIEHKVIEIFKIKSKEIKNCNIIFPKIKNFSDKMGLKILGKKYYDFKPHGATLIFILSSSHLAVHTWPENEYLHMDIVTCGKLPEENKIKNIIKDIFGVSKNQIIIRGITYEN